MFKLFKKKSELDVLQIKYRKLLEESHKYSTINRRLSDEKIAESEVVLEKIKHLEKIIVSRACRLKHFVSVFRPSSK